MKCPICTDDSPKIHYQVKEMMLGKRDMHDYLYCKQCECLYLETSPSSFSTYYPESYYSFNRKPRQLSSLKYRFTALRDRGVILGTPWRLLSLLKPAANLTRMIARANISANASILDVGSGNGSKLEPLANAGFKVEGIDPFLNSDLSEGKVRVWKRNLEEVQDTYDLIMFNHVFEHLHNPLETLHLVNARLNDHGKCMLRIPIIPNAMWNRYKTNWVQLDAPRHCYIHSRKSMDILAAKAGFVVENVIHDSDAFQFIGSELYKRDIALKDGDFSTSGNSQFTDAELKQFELEARKLNREGLGDQVAVFLHKEGDS